MQRAKRIFWWTLLAFFVYAVFTSPTKAADIIDTAWGIIVTGFNSIVTFFNSLLNHR